MSTSAMLKRRNRRASVCYGLVTAFCLLYEAVYTRHSYGESSAYLGYMFLFPLVFGLLPALIVRLSGRRPPAGRCAFNLWNAGVATLVAGCMVQGAIEIAGRFTQYGPAYWIAGGGLLAVAAAITLAQTRNQKERKLAICRVHSTAMSLNTESPSSRRRS